MTIYNPDGTEKTTNATVVAQEEFYKSITVDSPLNGDDISIGFTPVAMEITRMVAVIRGSGGPTINWVLRHALDRSAAGNQVVNGGTETTSQTTGSDVTVFDGDPTLAAGEFYWMEITAKSGTVAEFHLTIFARAS